MIEKLIGINSNNFNAYISNVKVVDTMLPTQVLIFITKHAASMWEMNDAIANEILRNTQKWVVSANNLKLIIENY